MTMNFKKVKKRVLISLLFGFLVLFHLKTFAQEKRNNVEELANEKLNITKNKKQHLYFINTKEVSKNVVANLDSIGIESISILEVEKAIKKYGRKGENGAVEVSIKQKWKVSKKIESPIAEETNLSSFLIKTRDQEPGVPNINKAFIIINGKERHKKALDSIMLSETTSISFMTGKRKEAEKYGQKGGNGIILIKTRNKKDSSNAFIELITKYKSLLFVIDGKVSTEKEVKSLNPSNIKAIDILKGAASIDIYGEKGRNGALLFTLKKF